MVMINTFSQQQDGLVQGVYRLDSTQRVFRGGIEVTEATLSDGSGQVRCEAWAANLCQRQHIGQLFRCDLQIRYTGGGRRLTSLVQAKPVFRLQLHQLDELFGSSFPRTQNLAQLQQLISDCAQKPMQQFLFEVFSRVNLARRFLTLPASRDYHHDYPGGLAEHSIETARLALSSLLNPTPEERALTLAAALLHDIGKIRTHQADGAFTPTGRVLRHEQLTLEILAEPLSKLDGNWPTGAMALRYLLTHSPDKKKRPLLPIAMTVQYADRMSASQSAKRKASREQPAHHAFVSPKSSGPKTWFWRSWERKPPQ
jgi:putative nucleotidyltransferase with HDIG domain